MYKRIVFVLTAALALNLIVAVTPAMAQGAYVSVPDVVGMTEAEAVSKINARGLVASLTYWFTDTVPAGQVTSQDPVGGTIVIRNSTVNLIISAPALPPPPLVVNFADPDLKAAVIDELARLDPPIITTDPTAGDMLDLSSLAAGSNIDDLDGLQFATNLYDLYLQNNQISDLSPLDELTELRILSLDNNQISDISPLAELTNLSSLSLNNNQISDLSPLEDLTNLIGLYLDNNQISDISPLSGLTNLRLLYLENNQISDLSPLEDLTNLSGLNLDNNQISDLSPLDGLTDLFSLELGDNQISDLSPLDELTELHYLYLDNNQISDVSPLDELTKLDELYLRNNPLNPDAFDIYIPQIEANVTLVYYGPTAIIPNVVGMSKNAADSAITSLELGVTHTYQNSDTVPEGHVISQEPLPEKYVGVGFVMQLTVSLGPSGPTMVEVPNVVGMTELGATSEINSAGLVEIISQAYSDTVAEGRVISQSPSAGTSVPEGSTVNLIVSLGPPPPEAVEVPDVVGMSEYNADSEITSAGLNVSHSYEYSDTVAEGYVISQYPSAGTSVEEGSYVDLTVSLGPQPVEMIEVPDVVGMGEYYADSEITSAGLKVSHTYEYSDTVPEGEVISQYPSAETLVEEGSYVDLTVSLGPQSGGGPSVPVIPADIVWDRAAYWDTRYADAWVRGSSVRDALESDGYKILNADQLKTWMDARIADGAPSVVVFCQDVAPDTVYESASSTCTLRRYLDAGGKVVWFGDIPLYYQGHSDGTNTPFDLDGSLGVLGFSASGGVWEIGDQVTLTDEGRAWGLTNTWPSLRPVQGSDLRILARDSSGRAAAWVKHYLPDDTYRGFVRFSDCWDEPNVMDIRRLAEYPTPLSSPVVLPQGKDIGTTGGSDFYKDGVYTIAANGSDIWSVNDEFRFVFAAVTGDFEISAHVLSLENTNTWAKAGVMVRETLDPDSQHAFMCVTPELGEGRFAFQYRSMGAGQMTTSLHTVQGQASCPDNTWVKIRRQGNTFTSFISEDGIVWEEFPGTYDFSRDGPDASNPVIIDMSETVYIGLAVTSCSPEVLCTAHFDNVVLPTGGALMNPPMPGLVGHWKLDETYGTIAYDSVGDNDGILYGNPNWQPNGGMWDGALEFDGIDDYVEIPRIVQDDFTLAAWIKTDTPGFSLGNQGFHGSGLIWSDVGGEANDFILAVLGTKLSFFCGNPTTSVNSDTDIVTGEWVHVAATRNAQDGQIGIYINGQHEKTIDHSNNGPLDALNTIAIGGNILDSLYYTGLIDDVRFYDRTLNSSDIDAILGVSENLLVNGGFEDGVAWPWTVYGGDTAEVVGVLQNAGVPEAPIEGGSCLHVAVPTVSTNYRDRSLQHVGHPFEKGKKYTLSAFLKCRQGVLPMSISLELGQRPWTEYAAQVIAITDEWAEYSITTPVMTQDVSSGQITFYIGYTPGEFWIDGVRLYEGDYVPPDF